MGRRQGNAGRYLKMRKKDPDAEFFSLVMRVWNHQDGEEYHSGKVHYYKTRLPAYTRAYLEVSLKYIKGDISIRDQVERAACRLQDTLTRIDHHKKHLKYHAHMYKKLHNECYGIRTVVVRETEQNIHYVP